jgi:uncharacterized cupredoxin-like copper-binding protein
MRFAFVALTTGALALAGCGADEFVRDRDNVLRIKLDEYELTPENIRVGSGDVTIVARNDGRLTHNIKVQALDRDEGERYEEFGGTETAHPGETVRATINLPDGKYRLACSIGNHDDLGQYGELQVGE